MTAVSQTKRILVIHYSQTGQLDRVVASVLAPLNVDSSVDITTERLKPVEDYPFPWPFVKFINTFPEAAHECGCELQPLSIDAHQSFDLVIIAYQVWFLAPSIPITAFMKSEVAASLLKNTPVITVIACRNMWLMAQEKMKAHLARIGAPLIGNIALTDKVGTAASFIATPLWLLTGKKGPFKFGIPAAGVAEEDIHQAARFGEALKARLASGQVLDQTIFQGLNAVTVNTGLIASEKVGTRSFYLWGKLFRIFGGPNAWLRKPLTFIYAAFLIALIITVVPVSTLIKRLFAPLNRQRIARQKKYFAEPSGEAIEFIEIK